jgi:hypothetical protein
VDGGPDDARGQERRRWHLFDLLDIADVLDHSNPKVTRDCYIGRWKTATKSGRLAFLVSYRPARRCQRVAFSIFLCFFFRMRLRRFLMSDPMAAEA